jgi:antitoxin MazE
MHLDQDSPVEIVQEQGRIIITPIKKAVFTLEELLDQIRPENIHSEVETGDALGNEVW